MVGPVIPPHVGITISRIDQKPSASDLKGRILSKVWDTRTILYKDCRSPHFEAAQKKLETEPAHPKHLYGPIALVTSFLQ